MAFQAFRASRRGKKKYMGLLEEETTKRTVRYTVAEIHELAQKRADEWNTARLAEYHSDPIGTYPMHSFEHASDQNYRPGPPSIKLEYHGM